MRTDSSPRLQHMRRWRVRGLWPPGGGHVAASARAPLPQGLRHGSSGLIFLAKDKELRAKESILPNDDDDDDDDDNEADAALMNRFIEDEIRKMLAQYPWGNKRVKTQPPGEASIY